MCHCRADFRNGFRVRPLCQRTDRRLANADESECRYRVGSGTAQYVKAHLPAANHARSLVAAPLAQRR